MFFLRQSCRLIVVVIFWSIFRPPYAASAVATWDNGGADSNWNTPENWSNDLAPANWPVGTHGVIHNGTVSSSGQWFTWENTEIKLTGTTTWVEHNAQDRYYNDGTFTLQDSAHYTASHDLHFWPNGNLNLDGGTISWGRDLNFLNGSMGHQSGGTLDGDHADDFRIDSTSVYHLAGGVIDLGSSSSVIEISPGGYLNFESGGTGGALTAAGYTESDMRNFVNTGLIRHDSVDGSGLGNTFFDSHFSYNTATSTLTAIPEPTAMWTILATICGFAWHSRRRTRRCSSK